MSRLDDVAPNARDTWPSTVRMIAETRLGRVGDYLRDALTRQRSRRRSSAGILLSLRNASHRAVMTGCSTTSPSSTTARTTSTAPP